ncbi:MAG: HAD family hydrolase [Lachnospiraceae bacterium]|nr:HAD family hydrolase [Lachnospiraceae bacterium]
MKYKAVIFDMDGTILDTLDDLHHAMNHILEQYQMPVITRDQARRYVGNGIRKLIARAVPEGTSDETIDAMFADFLPYYNAHCREETKAYDGIVDLLTELKKRGYHIAVVSNKADTAVGILAEDYFPGLFEITVGERPGVKRKPAPDSVNEVLRILGIESKDAIYVGDSDVDMDTAKNANMDAIGVDWGFRGEEFLRNHGASTIVYKPEEILDLV